MPLLARAKRQIGTRLSSSATVKEATQTQLCAYLSVALLVGLGSNALLGWWWADPLAALVIAGVAVKEGRESWRGEGCTTAAAERKHTCASEIRSEWRVVRQTRGSGGPIPASSPGSRRRVGAVTGRRVSCQASKPPITSVASRPSSTSVAAARLDE